MDISVTGQSEITIDGEIKLINHYLAIKQTIVPMIEDETSEITVKITNSPFITSALIGFFLRLIHENGVRVTIYAGNEKLQKLFEILKLTTIFNVKPLDTNVKDKRGVHE